MRLVGQFAAGRDPRCLQKLLSRFSAVAALCAAATALMWCFAATSRADAPTVVVSLQPSTIVADGNSTSTAKATITDPGGNPLTGETVAFSSSDPGIQFGSVADNGDGTYTASLTSSTTAGSPTITATDSGASASGQAILTQIAGPAADVSVTLQPSSIPADGASTSTAKATIADAHGNAVIGDHPTFSSSDPGIQFGSVTDNGDGTYTATLTGSTTAGTSTTTVTDGSASGQATLTQTAGPAARVALLLNPSSIVANGTSTATATATVTDAHGNPVVGDGVLFSSSDAGIQFGQVTAHPDGTYTVTLTSSTTAGTPTITATDGTFSDHATLTQTAGPAAHVLVSLQPSTIVANGGSTATATATVTDAHGNAVSGDAVAFSSSDSGVHFGPVTDNHDGTYTATLTASTTAGITTVTATDGSVSGQTALTQTAGPATTVSVSLQPTSIVANGTSTSIATATVTDAHANTIAGHNVAFSSSDPGVHFGAVTAHGDGTYTATLTSSTTAGTPTVTANDSTASISGQATLRQTPGPAAHATLALLPSAIVANGISESVATLTVTDAHGNRVPGESIVFSSSDPGELIGQVKDNGDGTYTTRIRSSTAVAQAIIKGTDVAANIASQRTLTQVNSPSTTALAVSPSPAVSNQPVTLLAAINGPSGSPHGTVTFQNSGHAIAGCANQAVSPSGTATCTTSFGASAGAAQLTAVFSPDAQSTVDGSTGSATLPVDLDGTSVSLGLSSPAVKIGSAQNLVAFVQPAHAGSLVPSGSVTFLDNGKPIAQCTGRPLVAAASTSTATCAVSYTASGAHRISATYGGDANFAGSQASTVDFPVQFLGTLKASMRWSFVSGPGYTAVLALKVNGAPIGSTVLVSCHGGGCPFANRALAVTKTTRCGPKGKRVCLTHGNVDLTPRFARRRLRPRATITVNVVQPGWIGRAYTFVVRSHQAPRTQAVCVAPGTTAPTSC